MSSLEENTSDPVIKTLCEKLSLLALVEGQGEYEQSVKRLFNGSPSNKPKAFIKPKTADEVCQVLQYASANHLQVSVLGGGHDPKGKLCAAFPFSRQAMCSNIMKQIRLHLIFSRALPAAHSRSITTSSGWLCPPIVIRQAFPVP